MSLPLATAQLIPPSYVQSSTSARALVQKAATTTSLTSSLNPSTYNQAVMFTATVTTALPGTITGNVAFTDGATLLGTVPLASGQAQFTRASLTGGSHSITATYKGNPAYLTSSAVVTQSVNPASTTATFSATPNPSSSGQSVKLVATVTAGTFPASGAVTFMNDTDGIGIATLNSHGVATLSVTTLPLGTNSLTAVYNGTASFLPSTSTPVNEVVNQPKSALPPKCAATPVTSNPTGCVHHFASIFGGLARDSYLYVPKTVTGSSTNVPIIVVLHPTSTAGSTIYQDTNFLGSHWKAAADTKDFILLTPSSTYNPATGQWFWNSDFLGDLFPNPPDDAAFIAYLICLASASPSTTNACGNTGGVAGYGYSIDPNRIFVTGDSSGGFMAQNMGIAYSDIIAAIAPVSGMIQAGTGVLPMPAHPVSYLEYHWPADNIVLYCGGSNPIWHTAKPYPSVDANAIYWLTANSCSTAAYLPLCSGNTPTSTTGFDIPDCPTASGIEVKFVQSRQHEYDPATEDQIIDFFYAHPKPTP